MHALEGQNILKLVCNVLLTAQDVAFAPYLGSGILANLHSEDSKRLMLKFLQDNIRDLLSLDPPLKDITPQELCRLYKMPLIPMSILDDRQYYISLKFGIVCNRKLLKDILSGTYSASDVTQANHCQTSYRRTTISKDVQKK